MDQKLVVPGGFMPSNLRVPSDLRMAHVEGDMYDLCNRVKEIDPNLFIVPLQDDPFGYRLAVGEICRDGKERLIFKLKELDHRVLHKLKELMSMPLSARIAQIDKDERKFQAQEKENELEELYENLGRPMWSQLEHDGFIQTRPVSYPKKGIKPTHEPVRTA